MTWTIVAVIGWPVVAMVGFFGADLLPADEIWSVALAAVLWSSLPWMGILWPVWTAMVSLVARTERRWMLVSLGGLAFAGVPVQCTRSHLPVDSPEALDVAVFNVNAYSDHPTPTALYARIQALAPDVLVTLERRFEDVPGYIRVADDFPASWPRPSHHSAVYVTSDVRAEARVTEQIGSDSQAMPVVVVWLPDAGVCVLGIHAPPQVPRDASGMQPYVDWLADRIEGGRALRDLAPCPDRAPLVLAGDFNHVPASSALRRLRAKGLTDVLAGTGLTGLTWPSGGGWPDFPVFRLDHVLTGPVVLSGLRKTRLPGSDHQAWLFRIHAPVAR